MLTIGAGLVNGKPLGYLSEFLPAQATHIGRAVDPLKTSVILNSLIQQKRLLENESSANCCCTICANPSTYRRVYPQQVA